MNPVPRAIPLAIPRLFAGLLAVLLSGLLAGPALAGPAIEVADPWVRPTIPNRPGAAYLEIRNTGDTADRLVGARAEGAGKAELHKAEQLAGVMIMAPVDSVEVPAGGTARLAPGGLHIMLFELAAPLGEGDTVNLTLEFDGAGDIAVAVPVERRLGHGAGTQHGGTGQGSTNQGGSGD